MIKCPHCNKQVKWLYSKSKENITERHYLCRECKIRFIEVLQVEPTRLLEVKEIELKDAQTKLM